MVGVVRLGRSVFSLVVGFVLLGWATLRLIVGLVLFGLATFILDVGAGSPPRQAGNFWRPKSHQKDRTLRWTTGRIHGRQPWPDTSGRGRPRTRRCAPQTGVALIRPDAPVQGVQPRVLTDLERFERAARESPEACKPGTALRACPWMCTFSVFRVQEVGWLKPCSALLSGSTTVTAATATATATAA